MKHKVHNTQTRTALFIVTATLLIALPVVLFVAQQQQEIRQRAAENTNATVMQPTAGYTPPVQAEPTAYIPPTPTTSYATPTPAYAYATPTPAYAYATPTPRYGYVTPTSPYAAPTGYYAPTNAYGGYGPTPTYYQQPYGYPTPTNAYGSNPYAKPTFYCLAAPCPGDPTPTPVYYATPTPANKVVVKQKPKVVKKVQPEVRHGRGATDPCEVPGNRLAINNGTQDQTNLDATKKSKHAESKHKGVQGDLSSGILKLLEMIINLILQMLGADPISLTPPAKDPCAPNEPPQPPAIPTAPAAPPQAVAPTQAVITSTVPTPCVSPATAGNLSATDQSIAVAADPATDSAHNPRGDGGLFEKFISFILEFFTAILRLFNMAPAPQPVPAPIQAPQSPNAPQAPGILPDPCAPTGSIPTIQPSVTSALTPTTTNAPTPTMTGTPTSTPSPTPSPTKAP